MPIKDSIVAGATDAKKARKNALGLTQTDLTFILQAIRDSKIPGTDLQQAIITIGRIQQIWEQFESAKNKKSPLLVDTSTEDPSEAQDEK